MDDIKVVTICGSMKFANKMIEIAHNLELQNGYAVIQCVYDFCRYNYSEEDKYKLNKIHLKKIAISDCLYIVNIDGYIGSNTKKEIEYAKKMNKEIIYYRPEGVV